MIETILSALMYPFLFFSLYFQVFLLMTFFNNEKKIKKEKEKPLSYFPSVTIAVPCWNEEKTVAKTLDSLLSLDYPKDKVQIIVVDDGSTDDTFCKASVYQEKFPNQVKVIHKENGGKHTAMNIALSVYTTELFGCLDADSFVEPDALKQIAQYFHNDKEIMAVTPCIHIKNPKTIIQRVQAVEYLMGVFLRKVYGELDAIQVTPGPFSIFRREVFEKIGVYKKAHNTEDFEITLRMHKHHMKIANSHKAAVYTVGPATVRGFLKQHLRWARGFLENARDYREMFFKKEYGNFGMFTLPGAVVFVVYGIYAFVYLLYSLVTALVERITRIMTIGIQVPHFSFDLFYVNTNTMAFITMIMFVGFLFVLSIGRELSDDKQEFYKNFPLFFALFPILVPIYLSRALFDTIFSRKNLWVLQDTKVQIANSK